MSIKTPEKNGIDWKLKFREMACSVDIRNDKGKVLHNEI